MYPEGISVANISARGRILDVIDPFVLIDEKSPSKETTDSVKYVQPMSWAVEVFYGGEFKITRASSKDELEEAKEFIQNELGCTIVECELLRVTANGDLAEVPPNIRLETIVQDMPETTLVQDIQYDDDAKLGGDVFFRLEGKEVRLFLSNESYAVSGIQVSEDSLVASLQDVKSKLKMLLN